MMLRRRSWERAALEATTASGPDGGAAAEEKSGDTVTHCLLSRFEWVKLRKWPLFSSLCEAYTRCILLSTKRNELWLQQVKSRR